MCAFSRRDNGEGIKRRQVHLFYQIIKRFNITWSIWYTKHYPVHQVEVGSIKLELFHCEYQLLDIIPSGSIVAARNPDQKQKRMSLKFWSGRCWTPPPALFGTLFLFCPRYALSSTLNEAAVEKTLDITQILRKIQRSQLNLRITTYLRRTQPQGGADFQVFTSSDREGRPMVSVRASVEVRIPILKVVVKELPLFALVNEFLIDSTVSR